MSLISRLRGLFSSAPTALAPVDDASRDDASPASPAAGAPERRARERAGERRQLRILVIDDSATIVALLRRMLRQNGYETSEAGDAEQGIALATGNPPDLIFLDIVLPGMNGFAALRHLRRGDATRDIPIIMISGNEQATEEFYLYRIGADDFMKKPFARAEVFARIDRLLDGDGIPRRVAAGEAAGRAESQGT
jgi:twitching motility two-component system response regulator PilH